MDAATRFRPRNCSGGSRVDSFEPCSNFCRPRGFRVDGKRTKEIAAALGVRIDTANAPIKNIYSKFAVHGRGAVGSEAIRRGFIRRERSTFGV